MTHVGVNPDTPTFNQERRAMNINPRVEMLLHYDPSSDKRLYAVMDIDPMVLREAMESCERSDDPMSISLASPGLFGGKGDAVSHRKKVDSIRKMLAASIALAFEEHMVNMLGANDTMNGYPIKPKR